ncbi:MAG: WbqC family protein [Flavobacteriaceae bacterium]
MQALLHPCYLPNIANFAVIAQRDVRWEIHDNFQKQTSRNRAYICTDRGALMLNIPIIHVGKDHGRQKYKDVKVDNDYKWQRQHWRTIQTAYRSSPFFEYYEDDIAPLYTNGYNFLLDYNLQFITTICDCLQIAMPEAQTDMFELRPQNVLDARFLVDVKKKLPLHQPVYQQVFGDRHGFIPNASVLDLLFNEGTNALGYLKMLTLDFLDA